MPVTIKAMFFTAGFAARPTKGRIAGLNLDLGEGTVATSAEHRRKTCVQVSKYLRVEVKTLSNVIPEIEPAARLSGIQSLLPAAAKLKAKTGHREQLPM